MALQRGDWRALDELSERDRALCAVAEKLSVSPTSMTAEDWEPLRELGLDDEGCLEVAHVVGVFNHLTRLADGFGLQIDPQTLAASESGEPLRRAADD